MDDRTSFYGLSQRATLIVAAGFLGLIAYLIFGGLAAGGAALDSVAFIVAWLVGLAAIGMLGLERTQYTAIRTALVVDKRKAWPLAILARTSERSIGFDQMKWIELKRGSSNGASAMIHLHDGELFPLIQSGGTAGKVGFIRFMEALRTGRPSLFELVRPQLSGAEGVASALASPAGAGARTFSFPTIAVEPADASRGSVRLSGNLGLAIQLIRGFSKLREALATTTVTLSSARIVISPNKQRTGTGLDAPLKDIAFIVDHQLGLEIVTVLGARIRLTPLPLPAPQETLRRLVMALREQMPDRVREPAA